MIFHLVTVLLGLATQALLTGAMIASRDASLNDFSSITWIGKLSDGKSNITITGANFEEIEAKAKAINSDLTIFSDTASSAVWKAHTSTLLNITCSEPRGKGGVGRIEEGATYLNHITGDCHLNPGPNTCSRVSCSWDSGIYWCNDKKKDLKVPCSKLGDYARMITEEKGCVQLQWESGIQRYFYSVHGQAFDEGGWNIAVGDSDGNHC